MIKRRVIKDNTHISKKLIIESVKKSKFHLPVDCYRNENSIYNAVLDSLIKSKTSELFLDLEIIECCTIDKYPKIVTIENSQNLFFIYDRYIETINDIFNCLYESNLDEIDPDIEKLVFGLKAENCLLNEDKLGFIYTALKYNSLKDFSFGYSLVQKNSFIAHIQVYFLVLHEFAHYTFKSIDFSELKGSIATTLKELGEELLSNHNDDEIVDITDSMKKLIDDENLIEECCCDVFAMQFMFQYLPNTINSFGKKKDAIKAIGFQLNTLSLLSLVNEKSDFYEFTYFELITYLRIGFFRTQINGFFEESEMDAVDLMMNESFRKYDDIFNTSFLTKFYSIEDEIKILRERINPKSIHYKKFSELYRGLRI